LRRSHCHSADCHQRRDRRQRPSDRHVL
jgi:hypothetical protein